MYQYKQLLDLEMKNQIGAWINADSQNKSYLEYIMSQYLYAYFISRASMQYWLKYYRSKFEIEK